MKKIVKKSQDQGLESAIREMLIDFFTEIILGETNKQEEPEEYYLPKAASKIKK